MAHYENGFWYDTPYPMPTAEGVQLWKKAFSKHYPLSPVDAEDSPCLSVHKNSTDTYYCTRKMGHEGIHRSKDFSDEKGYANSLATWKPDEESGLRGQVVAKQEDSGNYYDSCKSTTELVGSNKVVYVFVCGGENGHTGKHHSEPEYDAVPGYNFDEPTNILHWADGETAAPKKASSEKKTPESNLISSNKVYFGPAGTPLGAHAGTVGKFTIIPDTADFKPIGYAAGEPVMPKSFSQTISFTNNPNDAMKPLMCMHTVDNKNFCTGKKGHLGHHQGNGFGWYPDSPSVTPGTQRYKLISQASKIKKDPSLPPEVAQVMQDIIDYLKK